MSATRQKMDNDRFLSVLQHEISTSVIWSQENIQEDQLKAMQYYLGMPLGNEVKGRSQIVSWDTFEVIESAMPGLLEPFFAGDLIGKFLPKGLNDQAYSEQATQYVNYLIREQNPGFLIFATWIKDALLSKVGVVRADWVDEDPKRMTFEGLTDEQLALLQNDQRSKITAAKSQPIPGAEKLNQAQLIQMGGRVPMLHTVTVEQLQPGCVKIENVRPENFVLTSGVGSTDKARIIGEWVTYTRSELKELGYKQAAEVQSFNLASLSSNAMLDLARDDTASMLNLQDSEADETLEEIRLFKGFLRCDWNGDGIAEWRRVLVGGGEDPVLENDEAEWHNYCVLSPILIPHRVIGVSYADAARPIHELKTVLTRQYLDSLYGANRPSLYVNVDAQVSTDDLLSDRIGKIIRGRGPAQNALQPIQTGLVARDALEGLQLADTMRETRLGIPKFNPGLEADALHKTATGVRSINNLVDKRQKMVLRTFAETGIKDLFRLVLRLVTEYQDIPAIVRLRDQFVPFDPRGWNPNMDVSIEVGVGTSDETETLMMLQQYGQYMTWAANFGVVRPANVYEFGKLLAKNARIKGGEQLLVTDPTQNPPPPPPPDPKLQLEQFKAQQEQQKFQAEAQIEQQTREFEARLQMAADKNREEMQARQKQLEAQMTAQLEIMRQEAEDRRHREDLAFKQWLAQFQADQAMAMEQMRQQPQNDGQAQVLEVLQTIAQHIATPPRIVRDAMGQPVGVEKGSMRYGVELDPEGRISGLTPDEPAAIN